MFVTDIPTLWLRVLSVFSLGGAAGAFVAFGLFERAERIRRAWAAHEHELARELAFLRFPLRARTVATSQVAVLSAGGLSLSFGHVLPASLAVMLVLAVKPVLQSRRLRRVSQIEEQLDGFLVALASVLRATPALGEALEYSASLVSSPLRDELDTLVKEQRLGTPLEEALLRMGARVGSRTLQSALGTLRIGQRTGGDISRLLERSAASLREMARLEGVVRTRTAEGKAQAFVLAAIPFPLIGLVTFLNPTFLAPLLSGSNRGYAVIAGSIVLWLLAIVLARRILDVDI